jgi:hypothetical protein
MSVVGGLNYNGIKTLQSVEQLNPFERGLLPSRTQIQRAAYELLNVAQRHIPFEKKQSPRGEVFPYKYECFVWFILKCFGLYDIAQNVILSFVSLLMVWNFVMVFATELLA